MPTKYPAWLYFTNLTFMTIPKNYQEFFIRRYYYRNSEQKQIPDTIPVEHVEADLIEIPAGLLWVAKGFVIARNVQEGDNTDFDNDTEFFKIVHYVARLYFDEGAKNDWFTADISKKDFQYSWCRGDYRL